jgi:hypothetical protein
MAGDTVVLSTGSEASKLIELNPGVKLGGTIVCLSMEDSVSVLGILVTRPLCKAQNRGGCNERSETKYAVLSGPSLGVEARILVGSSLRISPSRGNQP